MSTNPPSSRKLIEVALPLEAINAACAEDKERKTGTIRNLHKWFAPMPVPALRALIFAALVDDPGDEKRADLLAILEGLVTSGVETPPSDVMDEARAAIEASLGSDTPIVLDPFCGGGSTLVEAQRLGLRSVGSDLNPIPVLISKVLTELLPEVYAERSSNGAALFDGVSSGVTSLVNDLHHYASRVRDEAFERLAAAYPPAPNGDPVIAWWWARTVESPDPRFEGCHTPLVSSWWLSKKKGEEAWLEPIIDTAARTIKYIVRRSGSPDAATKERCLFSGAPIPFKYVREKGQRGELGLTLLAVIANGKHGRHYFAPDDEQLEAVRGAQSEYVPELDLPTQAIGFRVRGYGMQTWSDLFAPRQQLALATFAEIVRRVPSWVEADGGSEELARTITTVLGLALGKLAQASSCLVRWNARAGATAKAEPAFGRHDLSMTWDFAEVNPFGGSVGDWMQVVKTSSRALSFVDPSGPPAVVTQADARTAGRALEDQCLIVTDPPYFASIGYANLSDYFYLWIRQALQELYPELFSTIATPKDGELIAEPGRHGSKEEAKEYFIEGFTETFHAIGSASRTDLPIVIIYAHKEQEAQKDERVSAGWEAMLEAIIAADLSIVGTWPIRGARARRMVEIGNNALATYVAMVCRERVPSRTSISRRELMVALRSELTVVVRRLQEAAIAPVDLAQAVLGPGMAVFTRYESVVDATGKPMTVRDALLLINAILAEVIDQQESDWDADTRWAVTWFEQHEFAEVSSGVADALARAKVTSIEGLERAGIITTRAGKTRLLRRDELSDTYDPRLDSRATVWEAVQHLVKALDVGGEEAAADLLAHLPEAVAARDLAYRLHATCERRGWMREAAAYNMLGASWPEIARLAAERPRQGDQQTLGV